MEKELMTLDDLLTDPDRPFVALLGGAKVSGKIGLIRAGKSCHQWPELLCVQMACL